MYFAKAFLAIEKKEEKIIKNFICVFTFFINFLSYFINLKNFF